MEDDGEPGEAARPAIRRRRRRRFTVAVLATFAVVVAISWVQRLEIADGLIRRELERRGVRATYRVEAIGIRTQRIADLVIGDPARPDLTARSVEIDLGFGPNPAVTALRIDGARIYGRWADGRLRLGDLDSFLTGDGGPPRLPFLDARIRDLRARIDTPAGPLALVLNGSGWLDDGFRGTVGLLGRDLASEGCALSRLSAFGAVAIDDHRPAFSGPVRLAALACPAARLALADGTVTARAQVGRSLDRGSLAGQLDLHGLTADRAAAAGIGGVLVVQGTPMAARYSADLTARSARYADLRAATLSLVGEGRLANGAAPAYSFRGRAGARGAAAPSRWTAAASPAVAAAAGTPLGPILAAGRDAAARGLAAFDVAADLDIAGRGRTVDASVGALRLASRSGIRASADEGIRLRMADGRLDLSATGAVQLAGGGMPDARVRIARADASGLAGTLSIAPYRAGGAKLAVPELRFARTGGDWRFDGRAQVSGPLGGGRVEGLALPIAGRLAENGALTAFAGCAPVTFDRLRYGDLTLDGARVPVCPGPAGALVTAEGFGGARIAALDLAGTLGRQPLSVAAGPVTIGGGSRPAFAVSQLAVRLGDEDDATRLDAARLNGRVDGARLSGTLEGASARIANVPLVMEEIAADWRFADGALAVGGALTVRDAEAEARFAPAAARNVALRFADGRIDVTGDLHVPEGDAQLAAVTIRHDLAAGVGAADFAVQALRFDETVQPDTLSRRLLGVVANVAGTVSGEAQIAWDEGGVRSTGRFATEGLDLAAAFGPVTGARGTIVFTDLLGLQTAPHQRLHLAEVNPGIAVLDGILDYQLLPDQRVAIEGGRWPLAGGELALLPAVLDFSEGGGRTLAFQISGLEAARLVDMLDIGNLNATGVFDGTVPVDFSSDGARIANGELVSREDGGTLAYVGELTYKDLSPYANFAFQALRSIRYRQLAIVMNGDLGGEIITRINFSGLQQGAGARRNLLTRQFEGLPIQFNVTVTAPFMQLMNSVRGYYDPALLIRQNLPALIEEQRRLEQPPATNGGKGATGVQDAASEDMR